MSKAQNSGKATEEDKKKATAKNAPAEEKAKPASRAKPAAKAADKKTAAPEGTKKKTAAPAPKAPKTSKAPATDKAGKTDKVDKAGKDKKPPKGSEGRSGRPRGRDQDVAPAVPPQGEPVSVRPRGGFTGTGLSVKLAPRKPVLSIAPGVMILGKASPGKNDVPEKASERKLSKKELADFKTSLMEKRERLLAGMRRELAVQRERAESKAADEIDKATDAYDEDLSFEIAIANDQELGEIQVALEKIEKGTYGECEICGCTISPSRLHVLPSATTCVACRGQEEMARRRDDGNQLFTMLAGEEGDAEAGDA